jgi:hypothetical protein
VMMGFGLAFATVALFHQVGAAIVLSATLRRRAGSMVLQSAAKLAQSETQAPSETAEHSSSPSAASREPSWAASATGGRTIHAHR